MSSNLLNFVAADLSVKARDVVKLVPLSKLKNEQPN
jgi:hypothetical protein